MSAIPDNYSVKWDKEEKLREHHIEIEFVGDHIHDLKNDRCIICNKTMEEICS